jgi:hypothetical protein
MIQSESKPWNLLLPFHGKIIYLQENLYGVAALVKVLAHEVEDLLSQIEEHAWQVQAQMKQFEEGVQHERTKTTRSRRKKPVVHGLESKRNKRKHNEVSKYSDSSL